MEHASTSMWPLTFLAEGASAKSATGYVFPAQCKERLKMQTIFSAHLGRVVGK